MAIAPCRSELHRRFAGGSESPYHPLLRETERERERERKREIEADKQTRKQRVKQTGKQTEGQEEVKARCAHRDLNPGPPQKGLRERISPICTLSQNGYGASLTLSALTPFISSRPVAASCIGALLAGRNLRAILC